MHLKAYNFCYNMCLLSHVQMPTGGACRLQCVCCRMVENNTVWLQSGLRTQPMVLKHILKITIYFVNNNHALFVKTALAHIHHTQPNLKLTNSRSPVPHLWACKPAAMTSPLGNLCNIHSCHFRAHVMYVLALRMCETLFPRVTWL